MKTLKIYSVVIFFVVLIGVALGLTNVQQDLRPELVKAKYESARSQYLRINNQSVHYTDSGDGPVLLMLHGVGDSLHMYNDIVGALARNFRVITVTLPGHGLTGPAVRRDYSIEAYTEFLHSFISQMRLGRVNLVGYSLGGYIAWSYAQKWPRRVSKLVLIDSAGFPDSYRLPVSYLVKVPKARELIRYVTPKLFVRTHLMLSYLPKTDLVTEELVQRYYDLNHRQGNRAALVDILTTLNQADPSGLQAVLAPTLILWGAEDRIIPPKYAERFRTALPDARLRLYKGLGHSLVDQAPLDIVNDIRKFIAPNLFR